METKVDRIIEKLDEQGNRLTAIEADLRHHVQRSERLETIVAQHEKWFWAAMGAISIAGPAIHLIIQYYLKLKS